MPKIFISEISQTLYEIPTQDLDKNGSLVFNDVYVSELLAEKLNKKRGLIAQSESAAIAAEINAMGLITEILEYVILYFQEYFDPEILDKTKFYLETNLPSAQIKKTLKEQLKTFPTKHIRDNKKSIIEESIAVLSGKPAYADFISNFILINLANSNPAFSPYSELFDNSNLLINTNYQQTLAEIFSFLDKNTIFGNTGKSLIEILKEPAKASPDSLTGQLQFIQKNWSFLRDKFQFQLLFSLDNIKEHTKFRGTGPVPVQIPEFSHEDGEPERFTMDKNWMPNLVMIAKNSFVWLEQLSKKYKRSIKHLDHIPDQELNKLAQWGINGLWLIGLWERSPASARIKKLCGNPEAIASAYSIHRYDISWQLGGNEAYQKLSEKAKRYGICLASDMVPNHMGIDSDWVSEHPDWFVSSDQPPFPSYSFNGKNLSNDDRTEVYLEDHYYSRSDASVVFKHIDRRNWQTRYIYHGNDGTSMPWNDTAQLNYLNPEVREAVYQTILMVARKFPVIRFDAAMTLTKKHYQRLWYPQPGRGGDIPSRSRFALADEDFHRAFPQEFWREVVERLSVEAPDTLLLAEAFWLMESYFVRTLGMHRVYNSAFMNLLRDEDNRNYKAVMKNTIEFEPEILKRYVNFMNNPDERTAIDQFGKGDKYFGISVLLATMPGLPMIGHGQIEGFAEKYGMEYYKAYWDESEDVDLIKRHEREIFPMLHKRYLFSEVKNFLLYDFCDEHRNANDDVYAYSNGIGKQRALIVYHNKFADSHGWIKTSASYSHKDENGDAHLESKSLYEGLNLHGDDRHYVIFKDEISGLEYIRSSHEIQEKGLFFNLGAYKYHVFLDIYEIKDTETNIYKKIHAKLNGEGVHSINEKIFDIQSETIKIPFQKLVNKKSLKSLFDDDGQILHSSTKHQSCDAFNNLISDFHNGIESLHGQQLNKRIVSNKTCKLIDTITGFENHISYFDSFKNNTLGKVLKSLQEELNRNSDINTAILFVWINTRYLGLLFTEEENYSQFSAGKYSEWRLWNDIHQTLFDIINDSQFDQDKINHLIKTLIQEQNWGDSLSKWSHREIVEKWLNNSNIQILLEINQFKNEIWFNQESLELFSKWMRIINIFNALANYKNDPIKYSECILFAEDFFEKFADAIKTSDYKVKKLIDQM